jgi:hypothetical protein
VRTRRKPLCRLRRFVRSAGRNLVAACSQLRYRVSGEYGYGKNQRHYSLLHCPAFQLGLHSHSLCSISISRAAADDTVRLMLKTCPWHPQGGAKTPLRRRSLHLQTGRERRAVVVIAAAGCSFPQPPGRCPLEGLMSP